MNLKKLRIVIDEREKKSGIPDLLRGIGINLELKKAGDDEAVFKHAGTIMIKSNKKDLLEELEEQIELAKTKASLLAKQEERLKATLQEQETKIQEMMKGPSTNTKPSK